MIEISSDILISDIDFFYNLESLIPHGWSKQMLMDAYLGGGSHFLKAVVENQIVGYINYAVILDEAEINGVAVSKAQQKKGIGKKLIDTLSKILDKEGIKSIFLEVNQNNTPAIKLYQKCGFELISERKNYYGNESALIFQKKLNSFS